MVEPAYNNMTTATAREWSHAFDAGTGDRAPLPPPIPPASDDAFERAKGTLEARELFVRPNDIVARTRSHWKTGAQEIESVAPGGGGKRDVHSFEYYDRETASP